MRQTKKLAFMFSGQGSHYPGMGKNLYEQNSIFRDSIDRLDKLAYKELGRSVVEQIYGSSLSATDFDKTELTHPAIFMVEYALAETVMELGIQPDFVLGASLGEVVGAVVTGMLTVEDALRFVIGQAKVFNSFCLPGGMMAVLCSPDIYTEYSQMVEGCELSGLNGSEIFVVSGSNAALTRFEAFLKARDIATSRLPVSHAFHSRLMDPAKQKFLALLRNVEIKRPHIPMLSCTRVDFAEEVSHEYFWDVVRKPLNVRDTVQKLLYLGDYVYLDISPSGTMSNLVKYNAKNQTVPKTLFLLQPFGGESARLQSVVEELKTMFPKP